ncbi:MAG: translation elongation factor-like protein [DPANN group archaeon]|nr:translation elongation factor-like protein [DPANN group archaeon]
MPAKKATAKPKAAKVKPKDIAVKAKPEGTMTGKKLVGTVTHFFDKISVAVIKVNAPVAVGDELAIEGPQTNIKMKITSMQVEHEVIKSAKKGDDIGMKVPGPVKAKDLVFKV